MCENFLFMSEIDTKIFFYDMREHGAEDDHELFEIFRVILKANYWNFVTMKAQ